jgi:hypothetical protein
MKNGNGRASLWVRLACFLIAVALLGTFGAQGKYSRFILQASPFAALCTIIAKRTIGIGIDIFDADPGSGPDVRSFAQLCGQSKATASSL